MQDVTTSTIPWHLGCRWSGAAVTAVSRDGKVAAGRRYLDAALAQKLALAEFEGMVAKGEIHYYIGQGSESFGGGTGSSAITTWVAAHFKSETVGGVTVYNLTQEK